MDESADLLLGLEPEAWLEPMFPRPGLLCFFYQLFGFQCRIEGDRLLLTSDYVWKGQINWEQISCIAGSC